MGLDKFVGPTAGATVGSRYWAGLAGHTCCCWDYILGWTGRPQLLLLLGADIVQNCPVVAAAGSRYWAGMAPAGATSRNKYCAELPRPSCCCCWEQALCWAGRSQLLLLGAGIVLGWPVPAAAARSGHCAGLAGPSCAGLAGPSCAGLAGPSCCCWEHTYTVLCWAGRPQLLLLLLLLRCDNVTPDTKIGGKNAVASHHFSY
jgi:hypothetical protein